MPDIQLKVKRTDRQRQAWEALDDVVIDRLLYGGAKGGGKSFFMCIWLFTQLWSMAAAGNLERSLTPPHVAWFGRKNAVDFTGTTLETWKQVIPEQYYEIKGASDKHPRHILIDGRICLDYGGLDKTDGINKFNSAEYVIVAVDQAEEVAEKEIGELVASLRMVLKDKHGKPVLPRDKYGKVLLNPRDKDGNLLPKADWKPYKNWPFKELYTANPRQCWLKKKFIYNPDDNATFVSALPSDNPHLPDSYIKKLKDAFKSRPELLAAYLKGDWSALEGVDQVIKQDWIDQLDRRTCYAPRVKRYLVCDYARFGDDECVIYLMENVEILGKKILAKCDANELVNRLCTLSHQNDECTIVIESIGADMGGAVADMCRAKGHNVIEFNPGAASQMKNADGKAIYENLRAEAWVKAANILQSGILDEESNTLAVCHNMYDDLTEQLTMPSYDFGRTGDKVLIESKKKIKERLGRSPDHGDTYVIACWAWDKISYMDEPEDKVGYSSKPKRKRVKSAMRC